MYNDALSRVHFSLFLMGFHLTLDFMRVPGIVPRRIYTYEQGTRYQLLTAVG